MEEIIKSARESEEKGYGFATDKGKKLKYFIKIESIEEDGDYAVAKVTVDGKRKKAYPFFFCFDENEFELKKKDRCWLITSLKCDDKLFKILNERVVEVQ